MRNLYAVLGVTSSATPEEVRRAYRRRAKKLHPDHGGSVEAFGELALAYETLSDERSRAQYDATGTVEPRTPDNLNAGAMEIIYQKLGVVIYGEHDLGSLCLARVIEDAIKRDVSELEQHIASQRRAVQRAEQLRSRLKCKSADQESLMAKLVDWHEQAAIHLIKKNEHTMDVLSQSLNLLEEYGLESEFPQSDEAAELSEALHTLLNAVNNFDAPRNANPLHP
jgi:curved DNA-binding protein CbpA